MTSPGRSRGSSPLRVGALALLGVGVVAAIIGLFTLADGGSSGAQLAEPAPPASTSALPVPDGAPSSVEPPVSPSAASGVPVPSFGAPAPAAPSSTAAGSGSGARSGSAARAERAPVRVYNNSTITGLAARAADDFTGAGWPVDQVANYPSGIIPTSTVYYRPGTGEQTFAQEISDEFGLRAEPRFEGLDDASPGLIVIVTNDYQQR